MLFLSISFYMMITTKYTHALGDYVIEFIGLNSWTGDYSGTHLTIYYFAILSILGLYLVRKYAKDRLGIKTRYLVGSFIVLITIFSLITNLTAQNIKKSSDGLLTIGYNSKNSRMDYEAGPMEYTKFNAEIELVNYGDKSKEFYIAIDSPFFREEDTAGNERINIFTKDDERAIFKLNPNETKTLKINLDEYNVEGGRLSANGGGAIEELVLTDIQGNVITLESNNIFGVELGR